MTDTNRIVVMASVLTTRNLLWSIYDAGRRLLWKNMSCKVKYDLSESTGTGTWNLPVIDNSSSLIKNNIFYIYIICY